MKCRIHGKRLMETTAYKLEGDWTPDTIAMEVLREFPHSIPYDLSLQPDRWYKTPEQILYCPDCESQARLLRFGKRLREE